MKLKFPLVVALFVVYSNLNAQTKWPSTLLWKISGNGLKKDSYLYGSMHMLDKRLFYFSDSLYHFIEKADGFAMEISIRELMDTIMTQAIFEKQKDLYKPDIAITEALAEVEIDSAAPMQPPPPPPPGADLEMIPVAKKKSGRDTFMAKNTKELMPTIMDTWLQSIAHRHNKWLGAIEDVGDQLPLLDQFGTSIQKTPEGKSFDPTPLLLEMMVNYYLKKDLNAIEKWLVSREDRFDMIKRNKKMAYRIDSLAQIRSIFFTVGAAHLPGDSGVIKLLRNRGFHVEPVWSSKTIDPDDYLKNLPELKWITFREANGDYEIDLPGTPSPLVSNGVETQFYMDLSTMTFYMAGGLVAPNNASLDSVTKSMMKNMNADLISSKPITYQSLSGLENVFDSNDGHFVVRLLKDGNIVYLLMVGSEKEEVITSPDAGRYFSSFKPLKKPSKTNLKDEWVLLSLPEKGVKLEFPIKPKRNKAAESKTEGTNWSFQIYDLFDMKQEGYFLLNIRETMPGYHLTEDSVFFKEIETSIKDNLTKVTEKQLRTYQGYPSYYLKGINEDQGTTFGLFMVIRGNRIYQLVAGGATSNKNVDGLIERFFTQLNLIEYDATPYSRKNSPSNSFQVYGPKDFHVVADSNATTSKTVHYTTFDDQRQVTYEIYAEAISPYLWTATDSAFLEEKGKVYIAYNDSIESKKAMWNGKAPSLHWVVKEPGNNLKKLVRVVASKDSLYTLITVIQTQEINASDIFFNKFLTTTAPGKNLTASKTSLLLKDLQSKDTATFEEAKEALSVVKFDKKDLPSLHQHLLKEFPDDGNYYWTVRHQLVDKIAAFQDKSSIKFVKEKYPSLTKQPVLQYHLIGLLSDILTKDAYALLKTILIQNTPAEIDDRFLDINWFDSLELSRTLYPEILTMVQLPLLSDNILNLTATLLREEYLSPTDLVPFEATLLQIGKEKAALAKIQSAAETSFYELQSTIRLMAASKNKELNNVLNEFLEANNLSIKMQAAMLMLDKKISVPQHVWDSMASSDYYRRDIYDSLSARNLLHLFPEKYLTQELIAASDMYIYASDEEQPDKVELLEAREIDIDGVKKRIYFFRVTYVFDAEDGDVGTEVYLGMIGAYNLDRNDMTIGQISGDLIILEDEELLEEKIIELLENREP